MSANKPDFQTILKRNLKLPAIFAQTFPRKRVVLEDLTIELFVAPRTLPLLANGSGLVVPVGTDLKMIFGVAKLARDKGADFVQDEAKLVAPLEPGDAFVGTGARYRYDFTALAVIFDEQKRTSPEIISKAISTAVRKIREKGGKSVILADITDHLLPQPNWITEEMRKQTAQIAAKAMVDAIVDCGSNAKSIKIWCIEPLHAPYFIEELEKLHKKERSAQIAAA